MSEPSVDTRNNSGHFDAEVNIPALARMTKGNLRLRPFLDDGRIHCLLAEGRLPYPVPAIIDEEVARLKLTAMGLSIDMMTAAQEKYLSSWQEGTT